MVTTSPAPNRPDDARIVVTMDGVARGIRRVFPIAVFVVPFGIAFGAAAIDAGLTLLQAVAMSVLVFSGAAQFAALDFWPGPIAFGSLALVVLALNARHIIMGAALSPWINRLPIGRRTVVLALLSDPNFADSQPAFKAGERDIGILLGGGLILWVNWIIGTGMGAAAGSLIGDPARFGVDVVMACFFAAVVAGQCRNKAMILPALVSAAIAIISIPWMPVGWNVILAALVGGLVAMIFHDR